MRLFHRNKRPETPKPSFHPAAQEARLKLAEHQASCWDKSMSSIDIQEVNSEVYYMERFDFPISYEDQSPTQCIGEVKRQYFDFIITLSDTAMLLKAPQVSLDEMIRHSLPPRYHNAELQIVHLNQQDYMNRLRKFGVRVIGYKDHGHIEQSIVKKVVKKIAIPEYCNGCGSPEIIKGKCQHCGRSYV